MSTGKKRTALGFIGSALAVLVVVAIGAVVSFFFLDAAPSGVPAKGVLVVVREGAGAAAVARDLESAGAVRNALFFRLVARLRGEESSLKSGTYRIGPGQGTWQVLDLIVSGKQALLRVTVPEGYTLSQTASLLERLGVARAADFLAAAKDPALIKELGIPAQSLEGYLFPDTYFLPPQYPAADVVRGMVSAFRAKLASAIPEASGLSAKDLQERLILASIIEREYRLADEAPLMASVFYNRLRIGMALQSCATVVYVITEKLGKPHPDIIYDRDLKIVDPYNTYSHRGLPPGPICSPGLTALQAVFRPASTKYLYFRLVDADAGRHHFSESLEEHNEATALVVKRVGG